MPEHRTATVAFVQFGGLDEVIVGEGLEAAAGRLDRLVRLIQEAVERYEVCFLDSDIAADGGKIRLSAGAPRVVGDDEERMLLALRHIVEGDPALPVRVGVNRGPVFTAQVGPAYRRWYAVMGDTVNLAARLGTRAPVGHIYATGDVLDGAKTSFQRAALEPFTVKGKARPVHAWDVGPPVRGASDESIRLELPLVGRGAELEQLRAAVADAIRGSGSLIELVGETGSGKSRLLAEADGLAVADGMAQLRATCEVLTRDTPYSTWRDLLRQLLSLDLDAPDEAVRGRLQEELEQAQPELLPWLSLIAIVLDVEVAPSVEVEQLAVESRSVKLQEVVLRFLRRALVVPTIVEVEQADLMDGASLALFDALAPELESSAWLVILTRRDASRDAPTPGRYALLELGPLAHHEAHELALATREASQLPPHVVDLAVERSGGSPQFLLDLLAAAAAGHRDELPDSVGGAAMARIDALDPADAALVRRASVLGLSFAPERLEDVLASGMPRPDERFWKRMSVVFAREPDGHVRFRRPALQEVAYSSLPFKLRRELHMAVGLRLEREQDGDHDAYAAVLSNHFALAGDYARAHRYAMLAAQRATEHFSHADAVRLYRRAIDAGRALGPKADSRALAEAWEQLGESLRRVGEPAAASRALTEARRLVRDDPIAQARLCDRQAAVASRNQALSAAVRWLMRGFRCLEGLNGDEATALRARMRSRLGGVRNRQGRWAEAIAECRQAISEAESVGERRALAHASYSLDWALVESGRRKEATHSWTALHIYGQLGDPEHESMVLNNLGMFAYFDGRWDEAVTMYRRSRESSERAGTPAAVAYTDCNIGEILSDQGRVEEAREHLERARRVWSATGERQSVTFIELLMARLATRSGQGRQAAPKLEAAMNDFREFGMDAYADFAQALLAEAEGIGGAPERALAIAHDQLKVTNRNAALLERVAGIALARLGYTQAALAELRAALESARASGAEYDIAATIDVLGALGGADADLLRERDEIMGRLKIVRLPTPALG